MHRCTPQARTSPGLNCFVVAALAVVVVRATQTPTNAMRFGFMREV